MNMASYEPDWDAGTENAYEASRTKLGDLCEICKNDLVVEGEDFCRDCIGEIEAELERIEGLS